MSSGDLDVMGEIGKLKADIEAAKDAGKESLILLYGNRLTGLDARLTGREALLPRPGKTISVILLDNPIWLLRLLFYFDGILIISYSDFVLFAQSPHANNWQTVMSASPRGT